jgi:uncharacterized protein (AIM24 family)
VKGRLVAHHKPLKANKNLTFLNDLLEYNANTNVATRGKGTMLIHPLGLKQFGQRVGEKLA